VRRRDAQPTVEIAASVLTRLPASKADALPIASLAGDLGCKRREIEGAIEFLRSDEHPVAAGRRGLWIERDPEAYRRNVEGRRQRALRQLANTSREMRTVALLAGQQGLSEAGL
jgi:hypothetical protein